MSAPDRAHRSAVRTAGFTLAASTIVSLGGNVQHALISENDTVPLWFALAWAAVPPLALPLAVHLAGTLGRAAAGRGRRIVVAGVMLAALIAFGISFYALRDLTGAMGYPSAVAVAVPVLIDVLAALATGALLVLDRPATPAVTADTPAVSPAPHPHTDRQSPPDHSAETALVATVPATAAGALTSGDAEDVPVLADADAVPAAGVDADVDGVDADVDGVAAGLVERGAVRADPGVVAAAVAGLLAGGSQRGVARSTGLHRDTVGRIAAELEPETVAV